MLLPGDPARTELIAQYLDDAHEVAHNREYRTFTGYLDGQMVSVCSTGIGGPSAAIAIEELSKVGADTFIRVGTCGGMQVEVESGDVVIATSSIRCGTSKEYVDADYPAVADFNVVRALTESAEELGIKTHCGVSQSKDAFYGQHEPETLPAAKRLIERWEEWKAMGCLCSEMESSVLFIVSALRRARAGSCFLVVANQEREALGFDNPVVHDTDAAIRVAIGAVRRLIAKDQTEQIKKAVAAIAPERIIFDFDGTIAFTEALSREAFSSAIESAGGVPISDDEWLSMVGHTDEENWKRVIASRPETDFSVYEMDELESRYRGAFLERAMSDLRPNTWVDGFPFDCAPCAVVSNNQQVIVDALLDKFGLSENFDYVISAADAGMHKESIWQTLTSRVEPGKVLVIEDSVEAIQRAIARGYNVIAISHEYNREALVDIDGIALVL